MSICSGRDPSPQLLRQARVLERINSRRFSSHLSPAPVSTRIRLPPVRISSEFIAIENTVALVGGRHAFPHRLRNDAKHGAAIQAKRAVGEHVKFQVAKFHSCAPGMLIKTHTLIDGTHSKLSIGAFHQFAHGGIRDLLAVSDIACQRFQRSLRRLPPVLASSNCSPSITRGVVSNVRRALWRAFQKTEAGSRSCSIAPKDHADAQRLPLRRCAPQAAAIS